MMRKRLGCSLLALFLVSGVAVPLDAGPRMDKMKGALKRDQATYKKLKGRAKKIKKELARIGKLVDSMKSYNVDAEKYNNNPNKIAKIPPIEQTLVREMADVRNKARGVKALEG